MLTIGGLKAIVDEFERQGLRDSSPVCLVTEGGLVLEISYPTLSTKDGRTMGAALVLGPAVQPDISP